MENNLYPPQPTIGNSLAIETPGFKEVVFIVNQTTANVNGDGRIEFQHENGINTLTKDIIENSNPSYPVDPLIYYLIIVLVILQEMMSHQKYSLG